MIDQDLIQDAAIELGVHAGFLEKETLAAHAAVISCGVNAPNTTATFTGGTSLSTAHDLINRLSEDVDIKVMNLSGKGVPHERVEVFADKLVPAMEKAGFRHVSNKRHSLPKFSFVHLEFAYLPVLEQPKGMRPHVQIELSGDGGLLVPSSNCEIRTILLRKFGKGKPVGTIPCVQPLQIAADKLSSLVWRTLDGRVEKEPEYLRHLHDLHHLQNTIEQSKGKFRDIAGELIKNDLPRARGYGTQSGAFVEDHIRQTVSVLNRDNKYKAAYESHVLTALYGEKLEFEDAVQSVRKIGELFAL